MRPTEPQLLAKSARRGAPPPPTVLGHCLAVRDAAVAIREAIQEDLNRSGMRMRPGFSKAWLCAALLHDALKANSAFQAMVQTGNRAGARQPVRHEILAAAMLAAGPCMGAWMTAVFPDPHERWAIIWAIAGHHCKMADPSQCPTRPLFRTGDIARELVVHLDHGDVVRICAETERVAESAAGGDFRKVVFDTDDEDEGSLRELVRTYPRLAARQWSELRKSPDFSTTVALVKVMLIAADVAASAVVEQQEPVGEWISRSLGIRLTRDDLAGVVSKGTGGKALLPFQENVGASAQPVTIVVAGCGNGKTTAAYLWAQRWAVGRKLFFAYPTTGTATAGFGGYLAEQHQLLSDLIHSKSEIDLETIRGTPDDDARDEALRIESLRTWDRKVIVCTVDTVIGLLQNQRRALYSSPAFMAGAFVFDEIHSFGNRLFGGLLRFLAEFPGIPVLIMSASIPPGRLKMLYGAVGSRAGAVITGDETLEGHKRYRVRRAQCAAACWDDVARVIRDGGKVLWVCNTVADAIATARDATKFVSVAPIVYHSRFRYCDRVHRQRDVLAEFKYCHDDHQPWLRERPGASLVVATQVCEMSLDISADMLVTAECPLPALVQRLGRLNRYATCDDPWPCLVYPFAGLPYNEEPERAALFGNYRASMHAMRVAVNDLSGLAVSQRELAKRLEGLEETLEPQLYSAWLDGGWTTDPAPVRDGDETIIVIREADLGEIETRLGRDKRRWTAQRLAPWTIPMNYRDGVQFAGELGPYPIAGDTIIDYSVTEGAQWKET